MKTLPLWIAAACLCAAFVDASHFARRNRNAVGSDRQDENENAQFKDLLQPGNEYCFEYNAQISSGYERRISPQQAMSRLSSKVCVAINQENGGTLRMQEVEAGQRNNAYGSIQDPELASYSVMQPMKSFGKAKNHEGQMLNDKLELPVEFSYSDGLVSSIQFHQDDEPWSKNIKKAVLNLIQLNASPSETHLRNPTEDEGEPERDDEDLQRQQGQWRSRDQQNRAFTTMEANVEGVCPTTYIVTPLVNERDTRKNTINVTKSVDFDHCEALADVAYGFQVEPKPRKIFPALPMFSKLQDQSQPSQTGTIIPKEKLGRSTTVRYVLSKKAQKQTQQGGNAYGIKRVELVSEYVMKSSQAESTQAMQTVAIAELDFVECHQQSAQQQSTNIDASKSRTESLLYNSDIESGEKLFFMKGDETEVDVFRFLKKDGQALVEKAVRQIEKLVKIFVEENKKHGGVDSEQSAETLEKLVRYLRVCTMDELRQVDSKAQEKLSQSQASEETTTEQKKQIATDLFADALAIAATRNTIDLMVEKIQNFEQDNQQNGKLISEAKGVQLLTVLGRGAGLPAPSEQQVDAILNLCKTDKVQKSENGLKQACWLTFGTMVGEVSLQHHKAKALGITMTPTKMSEICSEGKLESYKNELVEQLNNADSMYDKVLALKCIGNAGLIETIPDLRDVFTDKTELSIVRINAIDALRRLKLKLSAQKIQSQVLPIYVDTEDDSEVRMKAFGIIMRTRPTKVVADQIAMVMANEKSSEVQSFAYSQIKAISESQLPEDQKCAEHLKNALKLAQVDEDQMEYKHTLGASQRRRYAAYNQEQNEGVFVDWTQVFSESDASELPSHMHFGMDTFFNGQFNPSAAKLSVCQKDIEKIAKKIFGKSQYELEDEDKEETDQDEQEDEPGFFSKAVDSLKNIFSKSKIKARGNKKAKKSGPYVIAGFRLNDVDVAMAPILGDGKEKSGNQIARKVKEAFTSLLQHLGAGSEKARMHLNAAVVINSRMSSLPTSVGVGLRLKQSMYVLGQVKGSAKVYGGGKVDVKFHPNLNWVQTQKMEVLTLSGRTYSSGVQSTRSIELNLPLEVVVQQQQKNGRSSRNAQEYKLTFKVPEKKATFFGAHSFAATFTKTGNASHETDEDMREQSWAQPSYNLMTVYNQLLTAQERAINYTTSRDGFLGIPVRVSGHYQQPRRLDSLQEIMKVIMSGDNSLHVEFHPENAKSREVQLTLGWDLFQSAPVAPAASIRSRIQEFFSKIGANGINPAKRQQGRQAQQGYADDDSDSDESFENEQDNQKNTAQKREKQLIQHLEKQSRKGNKKHTIKVKVETIGSGRQNEASAEFNVVCDNKMRACDSTLKAKRSPLGHERNEWALKGECQTLYPEYVTDFDELIDASEGENKRQQKFFTNIEVEWGNQNQQQQTIKLQAEGEASKEMMKQIVDRARQQYGQYQNENNQPAQTRGRCGRGCRSRDQLPIASPRNAPFINKYTMVAEFNLKPSAELIFQQGLEMVKNRYFWNTESKVLRRHHHRQQAQNERGVGQRSQEQVNEGQLTALLSIDPITQQHANVTVLTKSHQVRIRNIELPMKVRPMKLVRPNTQSVSSQSAGGAFVSTFKKSKRAECKVSSKTVDTFDNMALKAPSSTCYTILAKDCSHPDEPKFAVLMKSMDTNSEEKKLKVNTRRMIAEIESKGENRMRIVVNDKAFSVENGQVTHESEEEELRSFGIEVEMDRHNRQAVIVDLGKLSVKFNGVHATIQLADEYKNVQCGLCGNFNDNAEDDMRKADDEQAEDVKSFHKSYTIQDRECTAQEHEQHYKSENNDKFGDYSDKKQEEVEPTEQTIVQETRHKVCFSQKPVKQCPKGWYPADKDEDDTQLLQRKSVSFSCLDRSVEAKRLKNEVRRIGTADISDYPSSFSHDVVIPARCVAY